MGHLATHTAILDLLRAFGIPTEDVLRVVITAEVAEVTTVQVIYLARDAAEGQVQRTYDVTATERDAA